VASKRHLSILNNGVDQWNSWRQLHPNIIPNFTKANLSNRNLSNVDFHGAKLDFANIDGTNFRSSNLNNASFFGASGDNVDFSDANLSDAVFERTDLWESNFSNSNQTGTQYHESVIINVNFSKTSFSNTAIVSSNLQGSNFSESKIENSFFTGSVFYGSNFSDAEIFNVICTGAVFLDTNMNGAKLKGCKIWGVSVWRVDLSNTIQQDLIISAPYNDEDLITVDNIEVAQFIYSLLYNEKIREIIDEITSKVVLILGRFSPERKPILDEIRAELRSQNYIPILFDFQKPENRDVIETVTTLAGMARFVIADITDAKTVIQELDQIVPILPSVPIQPILLSSSNPVWAGYHHLKRKSPNLLEIFHYNDVHHLKQSLKENIIRPTTDLRVRLLSD